MNERYVQALREFAAWTEKAAELRQAFKMAEEQVIRWDAVRIALESITSEEQNNVVQAENTTDTNNAGPDHGSDPAAG